jgi:hypothetical protein
MKKFLLFFSLLTFIASCKGPAPSQKIQNMLDSAGTNRTELSKVISYYSKDSDSLKLQAAIYLATNMIGKFYYQGEQLTNYMQYAPLVTKDQHHGQYILKSLNILYGNYDPELLTKTYDLKTITSAQMISHIDGAFVTWYKQPWSKKYTFEQFCEYVLPFRVEDEIPSFNRLQIYNRYAHLLKMHPQATAEDACRIINDQLKKEGWILSNRVEFLPHSNASQIMEQRVGSCREMVDLGIHVMRAFGIPVTSDFVPQWPYRRQGHSWNVVINEYGKAIPFLGAEDSPGTPHRPGTKRGKVYRKSFLRNPESLAAIVPKGTSIPDFLTNPYISDVTDEYADTHDFDIRFDDKKSLYGYLSVFDNVTWKPICWAKINSLTGKFTKVEGGVVYLPSYFSDDEIIPAQEPLLLKEDGSLRILKADTIHQISKMVCNRVYPIVAESYNTDGLKGCKFEGANKPDFSDAVTLFQYSDRALPGWNHLMLKKGLKLRYIRLVSAKESQNTLAELNFYFCGKVLQGKLMPGQPRDNNELLKAIDHNESTAYSTTVENPYLILDLGITTPIDEIRCLPKINNVPKHSIIPGKTYALKYWSQGKWKEFGAVTAASNQIAFNKLPSNALFLLQSDADIKDLRIFTFDKGRQNFW